MHKIKSSGVSSEVSTQATSTQIKPTFSRQNLGAELNNSINDFFKTSNLRVTQILSKSTVAKTKIKMVSLKNPIRYNTFRGDNETSTIITHLMVFVNSNVVENYPKKVLIPTLRIKERLLLRCIPSQAKT